MSLKVNFRNSCDLEGSRVRQCMCAKLNLEFCMPFLTVNQTWVTLTNSGHTVWALFTLKFYVPSTIYRSSYPPPTSYQNMMSHAQNIIPYIIMSENASQ